MVIEDFLILAATRGKAETACGGGGAEAACGGWAAACGGAAVNNDLVLV